MIPRMYKKIFSIVLIFSLAILLCYFLFESPFLFYKIYKAKYFPAKQREGDSVRYQYGVIIDAGSSGSRLFIYAWPPHSGNPEELLQMKPLLDGKGHPIVKKVNPGLSSLADEPHKAAEYLRPLLDLAASSIPRAQHKETPLYVMATAGMRMITNEAQEAILATIRVFVRQHYSFLFASSHAKVISGLEEGVYGWITTNYLLGRFNHNHSDGVPIIPVPYGDSSFRSKQVHHRKRTVGVIDMGGGSMQIAYELQPNTEQDPKSTFTFNLGCKENDIDHTYKVFVTTFLGFGANAARTRYERLLMHEHMTARNGTVAGSARGSMNGTGTGESAPPRLAIEDPCLHRGLEVTQSVKLVDDSQGGLRLSSRHIQKRPSVRATFKGIGKYHQCEAKLLALLDKKPCHQTSSSTGPRQEAICAMSGRRHPPVDLSATHFYGFSEFWYSSDDVLRLGGRYNYFALHSGSVDFCSQDWLSLMIAFKQGRYPHADMSRMRDQCFKSAWVTDILHHGLGFPSAYNKFTSVQEINGAEVQWSLGALLYQTRYFPLRQIEKKERDRKKLERNIRNQPKNMFIYFCLSLASLAVMATVLWMHQGHRWPLCWPPTRGYKRDLHKVTIGTDRYSSDRLLDNVDIPRVSGTSTKEFRNGSSDFKNWI